MKTNSGFDFLAPAYDLLSRIVFGKSIVQSQTYFLGQIPSNSKILILGGGTGWILEKIFEVNQSSEVWYVDASSKMIERSKSRSILNNVNFIQGTEADIPKGILFDVVITNFYLDLFSEKELQRVVNHVNNKLHASSIWMVTDFVDNKAWWQRWMLKMMYGFFNVVCKIEASELPDWIVILRACGWREIKEARWFGNFIKSSIFIKI